MRERYVRSLRGVVAGTALGAVMVIAGCGDGGAGGPSGDVDAGRDGGRVSEMDAGAPGCRPEPPPVPIELLPVCTLCPNARCVPTGFVPEAQRDLLADCEGGGAKCVPDLFVETNAMFTLTTCRSLSDSEGRCLSVCIPQVSSQLDRLPQGSCADDERCVPCFDPTSGAETGACGLGCDTGPTEPPTRFDRCCHELGSCVPSDLVPEAQRDLLGGDSCAEGALCAPDSLADATMRPPACRSIADAEGRCLPDCLPDVAAQADRLPMSTCTEHHLCVPCYDPLSGEPTGSCSLNGDMPSEPPRTFERCCGAMGACVPESIVPEAQRSQLGPDTCTEGGSLCVPDALADSTARPPTCRSLGDVEGRCLPACLPAVAAQADRLPRSTCDMGSLCTPCFDPLSGDATGACTLNGDMPAEPPTTFDRCCGGIGACVPSSIVPPDQRDDLGRDSCTMAGALCVPDSLSSGATPPSCRSLGDFEGRCLPECLPAVAAQRDRLPRSTCAAMHLCTPCTDPLTGVDTGACRLNGDMPAEPPGRFARCCGGIGSCVPASLVPADQRDQLGPDSCTMAGQLCAPDELSDSSRRPTMCSSLGGGEGRCLPSCLPDVAAQADRLPRDVCPATHLCAPCYDPISGDDLGTCRLNGDMPTRPPYTFPGCCAYMGTSRGRCVPMSVVPPADRGSLPQDSCMSGNLCVPLPLLADPSHRFPMCTTGGLFGGSRGACVPSCMVGGLESFLLTRASCAAGELCAPCTNPLTGATTGACR